MISTKADTLQHAEFYLLFTRYHWVLSRAHGHGRSLTGFLMDRYVAIVLEFWGCVHFTGISRFGLGSYDNQNICRFLPLEAN